MKTQKNILFLVFGLLLTTWSCVDDFLETLPKDRQTEITAFQTHQNFLTYSWSMYDKGFPLIDDVVLGDQKTPWLSRNDATNNNLWRYQRVTEATENGKWNFSQIRRANIMLANIDQSQLNEREKEHWRSVGLFFRAYEYFKLLSFYGAVPWAEQTVTDTDDIIFGPRDSRDMVAENILRDLKYAEANIKKDGDGPNTINVHVVRALMSRFGLFEGTWRKYHELGNGDIYLNACIDASEKLMKDFPELHDSYDELWNTEDLADVKGVILFRQYVKGIYFHYLHRTTRGSGLQIELTKDMVEKYLCSDGKPISTSLLYDGDKTPYDEFRNRDYRLLFSAVPPFRVHKPGAVSSIEWRFLTTQDEVTIGANPPHQVTKEDSTLYREYIDLLAKISKPGQKQLPMTAWDGLYRHDYAPRFRNFSQGLNPFSAQHGYWWWRSYDTDEMQAECGEDMVIFRVEEAMLNYAEAKFELGQFTQDIADRTINKLRKRVNVADMKVSEIDENFDLKRDQTVPPVLWEIRRERIVELLGSDFLFNDIRRWKKGEYYNTLQKGSWVKNVDYNNSLRIEGYASVAESKDKEGYVVYLSEPKGWLEHYYLLPIPLRDLNLNPQLEQNPGYAGPANK